MRTLLTLVLWELRSLIKLRRLIPLVCITFLSYGLKPYFISSYYTFLSGAPDEYAYSFITFNTLSVGASRVSAEYIPLVLFTVYFFSINLAGEFDSGLLKYYLSLPLTRGRLLLAKMLANFIILAAVGLSALYYYIYISLPLLSIPLTIWGFSSMLYLGSLLIVELLFIVSVTTYFSVLAPKKLYAVLYSLVFLYLPYILLPVVGILWLLPPYSLTYAIHDSSGIIYPSVLSIILLAVSYYLFTRKVEVG